MAHIYVYSPSGAVNDRVAFRRAVRRLSALGHEIEVDPAALDRWQRFAGDDQARLAAVQRAAESRADVAIISRGGYGMGRLLPRLPWRRLARAVERGTRFVGFSDFTALQLGLLATTGAMTWSGPALCESFGQPAGAGSVGAAAKPAPAPVVPGVDEITLSCFQDLCQGSAEGTGWRLHKPDLDALSGKSSQGTLAHDALLWGGNLVLVTSLLGTPWWPGIERGVLFLEDVGEHPYRIERMLLQLLHAGILQRQQAIVLGQFTGYRLGRHDRGHTLTTVVDWLRQQLKIPVLTGLPFGHTQPRVTLPVGARVDLLLEGKEAFLLWGHLDH